MTITSEHLKHLFDSDLPDPHLVVAEGAVHVVDAPDGDQSGLVVVSRAELLEQCGERPTGEALEELAVRLDTAITTLGG